MTDQDLRTEELVVLPQRLETTRWGGCGGCGFYGDGYYGGYGDGFYGHGGYYSDGVHLHDVIVDDRVITQVF
jgi:hypothetical protein